MLDEAVDHTPFSNLKKKALIAKHGYLFCALFRT